MNTDPHTKANIFYTVPYTSNADTYKLNVKIIKFNKEIFKYNGIENKSKVIQYK
jgi:hypothetical protein